LAITTTRQRGSILEQLCLVVLSYKVDMLKYLGAIGSQDKVYNNTIISTRQILRINSLPLQYKVNKKAGTPYTVVNTTQLQKGGLL
jgi:hypothetical protein